MASCCGDVLLDHLIRVARIPGGEVAQDPILDVVPQLLDRVQFRGIGRQAFEVQARVVGQDLADGIALVYGAVVPDGDDRATQVTQEFPEERGGALLVDVAAGMGLEVQAQTAGARRQGQAGDHRHLLVPSALDLQDGGLAARREGAANERIEEYAAFVDQDDVGLAASPFFRMRGQSLAIQRSMRAWSRSRACFSGFWGVMPRCVNQALR